jgi:hypothetical protein
MAARIQAVGKCWAMLRYTFFATIALPHFGHLRAPGWAL